MIDSEYPAEFLTLILLMAILYSSVGHGGASGYLAAMSLFGMAPETMRPMALTMNIFVSSLVLVRLARARYFNWRLFWPIALASIPMAYLGGTLVIADTTYKYIIGFALLFAAIRLLIKLEHDGPTMMPKMMVSVPVGAGLGLVSGLTGVGGGVFLSPLLLFLRWTTMRSNAAIAAAFILVNSIAGLAGYISMGHSWPEGLTIAVAVAVVGAVVGSEVAVRRLTPAILRKVLGIVLVIAAVKMIVMA